MTRSVRLDELCEIVVGRTPSRSEPRYWGGNHHWLSIGDMTGQRQITATKERLSDAGAAVMGGRLASPGTVLLSFKLSIGKVSIARVPLYTNEAIAALPVRDRSQLDESYLAHFLESVDLAGNADLAAMGRTLNLPKLRAIEIRVPSLPEQRRVASILDRVDDLIMKGLAQVPVAEELALSLFLRRFGSAREWQERWPVARLDSVAHARLGKMLDKARQSGETQWPYLRNANVQWMRIDVHDLLKMGLSEADRQEFSLQPGDVLVCEGGEPGRSAVWDGRRENVYFQKALHRVRLDEEIMIPDFFVWVMRELSRSGLLSESITSATIAHLTSVRLKALMLPVPPLSEQLAFVEQLGQVRVVLDRHDASIRAAYEASASMKSRAFRGEL